MKPISSAITGSLSQVPGASKPLGTQPGETGSGTDLVRSFETEMPRALVAADPEANTKDLVSRLRSCGLEVSWKTKMTFPTDPRTGASTWKDEFIGARLSRLREGADIREAKKMVAQSLLPAGRDWVAKWITALSLAMRFQQRDQNDFDLMSQIYIRGLLTFPGDIVRDTVTGWRGAWFPTWTELADRLDERSKPRRALARKLEELS
jgi:hypothetical protein